MPRRHTPQKHTPYTYVNHEASKTRYRSQAEAQKAAELGMLRNPSVELEAYQGADGGWYLTSQVKNH
ncbi:hypothetical protein KC949_00950 [Candidatus Saccharibacteria bacterium]|nr:hypothetical protein [Candidatus Saccharibacteria bacterium]